MIERITALIIISLLVIIILRYKYNEYRKSRRISKSFKRGNDLEKDASKFLIKNGYKIISEQYEQYHSYKVNGEVYKSKLIVDYLVSKKGKKYLVEVKSGQKAINIKDKNTRRQILEYDFAIDNDGIFLLDMENKEMKNIEFNHKEFTRNFTTLKLSIILAIGAIFIPYIIPKLIIAVILALVWMFPAKIEEVLGV